MDFDQVSSNIFVGSHPRTNDDLDELQANEITAVLNLQTNDDFEYLAVAWSSLHARYFSLRMDVRRVPIRDFDDGDLRDKIYEAASVLDELVKDGHSVYVHCSGGVNRSPSIVIAYLHWFEGLSLDEAADKVRKHHPSAPVMEAIRGAIWDRKRM